MANSFKILATAWHSVMPLTTDITSFLIYLWYFTREKVT